MWYTNPWVVAGLVVAYLILGLVGTLLFNRVFGWPRRGQGFWVSVLVIFGGGTVGIFLVAIIIVAIVSLIVNFGTIGCWIASKVGLTYLGTTRGERSVSRTREAAVSSTETTLQSVNPDYRAAILSGKVALKEATVRLDNAAKWQLRLTHLKEVVSARGVLAEASSREAASASSYKKEVEGLK